MPFKEIARSLLSFVKKAKEIDRTALYFAAGCFGVELLIGGSPLGTLARHELGLYLGSQTLGFLAIISGYQALSQTYMREKLLLTAGCAGLHMLQFALLGLAGSPAAWGAVLSMGLATARAAVFGFMTNPKSKTPQTSFRKRTLIAAAFVAGGLAYMFTGFGLFTPLVSPAALFSGNIAAIATALPMLASVCGAIGDAAPRTRYLRPIKSLGACINIAYNILFSGSLSHTVSEAGGVVMFARQFERQDLPPRSFQGRTLSLWQRLKGYGRLMRSPSLGETYFADLQKSFETEREAPSEASPVSSAPRPTAATPKTAFSAPAPLPQAARQELAPAQGVQAQAPSSPSRPKAMACERCEGVPPPPKP